MLKKYIYCVYKVIKSPNKIIQSTYKVINNPKLFLYFIFIMYGEIRAEKRVKELKSIFNSNVTGEGVKFLVKKEGLS